MYTYTAFCFNYNAKLVKLQSNKMYVKIIQMV